MMFQLQLANGEWQEMSELPSNALCYKKAIIIEGSKEVLVLKPLMTCNNNYQWVVA